MLNRPRATRPQTMLALVTDAFGGRGGIAQYNRDFLAGVAASKLVSSIVVLPRIAPDAAEPHIDGVKQLAAHKGRVSYALAAMQAALSQPIDIVFCGHVYMVPLAAMIALMKGAKLVVQAHGIEVSHRPTTIQRKSVDAADLVLCVSRHTRQMVMSWASVEPDRILVLANTVGEEFTPGDASALREAWGLSGRQVLLTVSRLDTRQRHKGHELVMAAIPGLVAAGHQIAYVVVGEGDDLPRLKAIASRIGITDRVLFTGRVDLSTLVEAYRLADVFVMPSTGDGFGIAFLEAMSCGTPAVGLASAGAPDALCDGELGFAVSESEFSSTLARLLANPPRRGAELAAAVKARFGHQVFVERLRDRLLYLEGLNA